MRDSLASRGAPAAVPPAAPAGPGIGPDGRSALRPAGGPTRQIAFHVDVAIYDAVARRAATMGRTVGDYARMLFNAAYSARCASERGASSGDLTLDRQVAIIFAFADCEPEFIAAATGFPLVTVRRAIEGFALVARDYAAVPAKPLPEIQPDPESQPRRKPADDGPAPDNRPDGTPAKRRRWTKAQEATVRQMYATGATLRAIGEAVGKSEANVSMWLAKHRDICPRRR